MNTTLKSIPLALAIALSGCAALPTMGTPEATSPESTPAAPTAIQEPVPVKPAPTAPTQPEAKPGATGEGSSSLTPDILFHLLAGEIATQRESFDEAYDHLYRGAVLGHDPKAAERAVRVALHSQNYAEARKASDLWVGLEPDSLIARQLAVLIALKNKDEAGAYRHLQQVVRIARDKNEDPYIQAIAALMPEKNADLALRLMQKLAAANPDEVEALYAVALVAVLAQDYPLAESKAAEVLNLRPDFVKATVLLSKIRLARGDKEGARKVLSEAVAAHPNDPLLRSSYARLLMESEEPARAYEQYAKLIQITPDDAEATFSAAAVAMQLEHWEDARKHLLRLRELRKRESEAAYYLGWIEEINKRPDAALEWYYKVDESELQTDALIRVSRLLAKEGQLNRARDLLQRLRAQDPDRSADIYLVEAELLRGLEQYDEALAVYNEGLRENANDGDLLYARAMLQVSRGKLEPAEADLRQVLVQEPENVDALNALGYTLADMTNRYQEALGYLKRALELKPDSAAVIDSMGWVQYRLGNTDEALKLLREAHEKLKDPEIASHYGELLWVTGAKEEARKVWKEGKELDPKNPYLRKTLEKFGQD